MPELPSLIDSALLAKHLGRPNLLIVCVGRQDQFVAAHIPGAVHLSASRLSLGSKPAPGLLPDIEAIQQTWRETGLQSGDHVVCYDDEAGTKAARAFWVLEAMGHQSVSFLDGGLTAWIAEKLPLESGRPSTRESTWSAKPDAGVLATKQYVLESLSDDNIQILDARSPEEHNGLRSASARRGKIPGALNLNWVDTIDPATRRLKSPAQLTRLLAATGIKPENEILVHCQTHQRSSHSFMMLRSLGFKHVRGYAGSWSEWAADSTLPIE